MPTSLTGRRWRLPDALPDLSTRDGLVTLWRKRHLHPTMSTSIDDLPSFSDYPDLGLAIERIRRAVQKSERIVIVGDYDCDGVTSTALLVRALRRLGYDPLVRLPHRVHDGYGLTTALATEVGEKADLLITVDTGVTAAQAVADLTKRGVDVIIIDHHHPPAELPAAFALIHPLTCASKDPWPSAAGLAHMVGCALAPTDGEEADTDLALAMLGTIADVVPLIGRNRTQVHLGLVALDRLKSGPLATLRDTLRAGSPALTSSDVAFRLAPRINAAGRLADPTIALSALLDGGQALTALEELNADRQRRTKLAVDSAVEKVLAHTTVPPLLSVAHPDLHPGVLGLVAAKLTERFGRPSLVMSEKDGLCTASLRGPAGYHLAQGLTTCEDLLERFGGHAQAAGCTFKVENTEPLVERLSAHIASAVPADELLPTLEIDGLVSVHSLRPSLINDLRMFEPFGAGNQDPRVLLRGVQLDGARGVGENARHFQARIGAGKLIGFGLGHLTNQADKPLDLVGRLSLDTWNGRQTPQLMLDDARVAE